MDLMAMDTTLLQLDRLEIEDHLKGDVNVIGLSNE
jgi:hypothetical protein